MSSTVAVVGGGLAGLSAACALANAGFRVTLLERRPYLGGRASSYEHPGTGEVVDNCQHVLLGCCTNLIDFYCRTGVEDKIRWYDRLNFVEPGGRTSHLQPSALPAPLHYAPTFWRVPFLSTADKLAITRAMMKLTESPPPETDRHFLGWLHDNGQTPGAINRFWKLVLVSALNEDLDRMSVHYAAHVLRESFLKSASAGRMGVPTVPLTELYRAGAGYIEDRGGQVRLRCAVESLCPGANGIRLAIPGGELAADLAVMAAPFDALLKMLPVTADAAGLRTQLARFETSPIAGIHFWFDREISDLDHAVLLDRTIQWMFHKSRILASQERSGSYVELVVSSSKALVEKSRNEILDLALRELREFFPAAAGATVLKATVIKEVHATYSALPRSDDFRPHTETAWPRVFLAGDWTLSGWPATMEGAVRSGYRAAEAVVRAVGDSTRFLVPDLPAQGLMRLFA
ncbi:MAG: hydroxysqualene dehydroxylase HpnE [Acidobacteria bacterium]|nr:hydroxysqualene dehydroxylase HpnE [Acidobacteriota bacterium]